MTFSMLISMCTKNVICLSRSVLRATSYRVCDPLLLSPSSSCCFYSTIKHSNLHYTSVKASKESFSSPLNGFHEFQGNSLRVGSTKNKTTCNSMTIKGVINKMQYETGFHNMNLRLFSPNQIQTFKIKRNTRPFSLNLKGSWRTSNYPPFGSAKKTGPFFGKQCNLSASLFFGCSVCYSTSEPSYAEANTSSVNFSHGKKILTNYSVIGIPGDGKCLFRSVAHGACVRSGKPAPNENFQKELADELCAMVADEFVKRREETEWFIEGDFDTYVSRIRKPHVWGGEPELLMASHVLQMPITVYMCDKDSGGLISIAEYGQEEYGKENPIDVLYHGFGHYDALHIPHEGETRSRL